MAAYLAQTNTATIAARNGVVPASATVSALQGGIATQLRTNWLQDSNNSALLSGATVGTGTENVAQLRKPVAVSVTGDRRSLVFGAAYATRSSSSSDAAYIVMPVTNTGTETLCFLTFDRLTYRDAGGRVLVGNAFNFVTGSVRRLNVTSTSTDTCLAPGESGMYSDIRTNVNYSDIASMEFGIDANAGLVTLPAARVLPQSYAVQARPGYQSLDISLRNNGTRSARLDLLSHRWFLLDDSLVPLRWGFASDSILPRGAMPVGASGSMSSNVVMYSGSGRRLLVFVDFSDDATAGTDASAAECASATTPEAIAECMQGRRNQRLSAQDATLRRALGAAGGPTAARLSEDPALAK